MSLYVETLEAENESLRAQLQKMRKEQMKSPWHKVADEGWPKETAWYFVQVSFGTKIITEVAMFDLSYGWLCRTDYDSENTVLYWMEIPELPKED